MLPVLLLVPGQTCTVLQVEGRAADLQIIQAAVGEILVKAILRPVLLARFSVIQTLLQLVFHIFLYS